jgi:hypothetical protein
MTRLVMLTRLILAFEEVIELLSEGIVVLLHCKSIFHSILHQNYSVFARLLLHLKICLRSLLEVLSHLVESSAHFVIMILFFSRLVRVNIVYFFWSMIELVLFSPERILIHMGFSR